MKPEEEKNKIPVAESTGFMTKEGERRYVMDQNRQLDLQTMKWFQQDNLGTTQHLNHWSLLIIVHF